MVVDDEDTHVTLGMPPELRGRARGGRAMAAS
jgi:hypothetical protein